MSDSHWHKGAPPHIGWWRALDPCKAPDEWRWWNGRHWSVAAAPDTPPKLLPSRHRAAFDTTAILWSHDWPEGARVPRLDPRLGHWNFNTNAVRPNCKTFVEVVFSNGTTATYTSVDELCWEIRGTPGDIVAWRPEP